MLRHEAASLSWPEALRIAMAAEEISILDYMAICERTDILPF